MFLLEGSTDKPTSGNHYQVSSVNIKLHSMSHPDSGQVERNWILQNRKNNFIAMLHTDQAHPSPLLTW